MSVDYFRYVHSFLSKNASCSTFSQPPVLSPTASQPDRPAAAPPPHPQYAQPHSSSHPRTPSPPQVPYALPHPQPQADYASPDPPEPPNHSSSQDTRPHSCTQLVSQCSPQPCSARPPCRRKSPPCPSAASGSRTGLRTRRERGGAHPGGR